MSWHGIVDGAVLVHTCTYIHAGTVDDMVHGPGFRKGIDEYFFCRRYCATGALATGIQQRHWGHAKEAWV